MVFVDNIKYLSFNSFIILIHLLFKNDDIKHSPFLLFLVVVLVPVLLPPPPVVSFTPVPFKFTLTIFSSVSFDVIVSTAFFAPSIF
ncbi:hypothetical protein HZA55_03440 [Candidatus Poribacteria bacterium]|nr:hypothetical protein [Candidatus Poribacteria bacterium]